MVTADDEKMSNVISTEPGRSRSRHTFGMLWLLSGLIAFLTASAFADGLSDAKLQSLKSAVNVEVAAARRVAPALGVVIVEVESGRDVYSYNADTPRIPASNTKLVTSAAALDRLGPGFFFETEILARGELDDGTLRGELAIVGGGDPNISGREHFGDSYGAFRLWIEALREAGVERLAGDLFLVHGLYDDERIHPDWPRDQLTRWYEAPVDALSFNDNCVLVKVRPNGGPGRPAEVEVVPDLPIFDVESTAVTAGRRDKPWLRIDRKSGAESHVLTAAGRISPRTDSVDKWVTVTDPPRYFGAALRAALIEEGIVHLGETKPVEEIPGDGWRRLHVHRTDLLTVLEIVNKRSQNFYSESVLKLLGARLCGDGSWNGGIRAVEEFLAEVDVKSGYNLADGSGMSRQNRFTPRHLTTLLRHMYHHPHGAEYLRTLPYSGERDLKWEDRLASPPYLGNVMAKTGYLNGVSTLSGYVKARSGKVYAFSLLLNGIKSKWKAERAQDRIVRAVVDHG